MRFFQRLAPGVRTQHAVQPALPPRFAAPSAGLHEVDAEPSTPPARPTAPAEAVERRAPPETPSTAAGEAMPPAPTRTRIEAIETLAQPAPVLRSAPPPSPHAAPVSRVVHVHEAGITPPLEAAPRSRPQRDDPPAPPTPQRPLSAIALAQRVQATKSDTTVVHVTIDRIDVRAPVPAQTPRAQPKPRAAPAMSLADYLRRGRS
jgi:hypothetical protein